MRETNMTFTLCTLRVENLGGAGQLLVGLGHVSSVLIAIGKRWIKLVLNLPRGPQNKTARSAPVHPPDSHFINNGTYSTIYHS